MRLINKAGLVAGALTALLILASCSDSDTSTGVTTGRQAANDASTEVVMHQGTAGKGEHSNPDTNHGHSPEQQHADPNNPTTSSVVALLSISNPICGNLTQEQGEQCDGGLGGNATCNTDCTLKTQRGEIIATTACGNGIVDPGEQCDDANDSNEDDCTQYCKTPVCGDGYVQGSNGEQCDDKNRIDSDGCNNACQSSTTTVVTTTTVIEQVNDDGGTTRTPTTTTQVASTPEVTTQVADPTPAVVPEDTPPTTPVLCEVTPVICDECSLEVSGAYTKASGRYTVRPNEFAKFKCNVPAGGTGIVTIFSEILNCGAEGVFDNALPECVAEAGGGTTTNCTFAPIANSDHKTTVTINIDQKFSYTCNQGFHLDGNSTATVLSNLCVVRDGKAEEAIASLSCVADEVSCSEEYATCTNRALREYIDLYTICKHELRFAHGAHFPTFKSIELECLARADRVRCKFMMHAPRR